MVFYLGWEQDFPRKNSCVLYFLYYLPTIESRSVSKISLTDCSRKLGNNTIHHPLVSCTLKSTVLKKGIIMYYLSICRHLVNNGSDHMTL